MSGKKKGLAKGERITELERLVGELRTELEDLRSGGARQSMRVGARCPMCASRKLLHFKHVKDVAKKGLVDLALQKEGVGWFGVLSAAPLEAFVCSVCRLVEWHAITLEDVKVDGVDVVEINGEEPAEHPDGSPYR